MAAVTEPGHASVVRNHRTGRTTNGAHAPNRTTVVPRSRSDFTSSAVFGIRHYDFAAPECWSGKVKPTPNLVAIWTTSTSISHLYRGIDGYYRRCRDKGGIFNQRPPNKIL